MTQNNTIKLQIGTQIRFLKDLIEPACGDHPTLLYASKGDLATVTGYNDFEGYMVTREKCGKEFGASAEEFEVYPPPNNIPPGIDPKWLWCARDEHRLIFSGGPFKLSSFGYGVNWVSKYRFSDYGYADMRLSIFTERPLANFLPENSLHKRRVVDGKVTDIWDWVGNES
jgi:hypothetical protein